MPLFGLWKEAFSAQSKTSLPLGAFKTLLDVQRSVFDSLRRSEYVLHTFGETSFGETSYFSSFHHPDYAMEDRAGPGWARMG